MYQMGMGVEKSIPSALKSLKIAKKLGHGIAEYQLFRVYSEEAG